MCVAGDDQAVGCDRVEHARERLANGADEASMCLEGRTIRDGVRAGANAHTALADWQAHPATKQVLVEDLASCTTLMLIHKPSLP